MNLKIKALENKIEDLKLEGSKAENKIHAEIQKELDPIFEADSDLQADKAKLENYKFDGYDLDPDSLVNGWVRAHSIEKYKEFEFYLSVYLDGTYCDFEYSTLRNCLGECILINEEDRDVFLNSKCIVEADSYETEAERNSLIEACMESDGYFPDVFEVDRDGNLSQVLIKPENENPKQGVSK